MLSIKRYINIFFVLLGLVNLLACKKYPEDKFWHLTTAMKRLRSHPWHLSKLYVNGADSTLVHLHNMDPTRNDPRDFAFYVKEGMNLKTHWGKGVTTNIQKDIGFDIVISNNKRELEISNKVTYKTIQMPNSNNLITLSIFWINDNKTWKIKKLTSDEFIMESNATSKNELVRIEFKK
jgi:hypothetical protein